MSTFGFVPQIEKAHAAVVIYYVDATGGLDTNTGTDDTHPWKTLTKVKAAMTAATIHAGDSVLFKRGETFAGNLVVNVTGTAGNILTFADYGSGIKPIINAAGNTHGIDIRTNKSYVTVRNIIVQNSTQDGIFLYANVSNLIIDSVDIQTGYYGIFINGTSGTFSNLTISNITTSGLTHSGFITNNFTSLNNLNISDSVFSGTGDKGIYVANDAAGGTASGITISNTTASNNTSWGMVISKVNGVNIINNCVTSNNGYHGVQMSGSSNVTISHLTSNNNTSTGSGLEIDNVTTGTVSDSTFNGNAANGVSFLTSGSNVTLTNVSAANNLSDGFNVHGTWSNVIFDDCTSDTNGVDGIGSDGDGFSFHDTTSGVIRNSISRDNMKSAIAHVGNASVSMYNNIFAHATNGTISLVYLGDTTGSGTYTLENNVIYSGAHTGNGLSVGDGTATIKNNIIMNFDVGFMKYGGTITEDYNDVYGATTANFSGLSAGAHDVSSDPKFVSPTTDFSLQSTSPAIDAGFDTNIATDYAGKQRYDMPGVTNTGAGALAYYDIGAYEYVTPPNPVLQSLACPSQTTYCLNTTPDIMVTNASSTTSYRYLVNQTLSPSTAAVKAGTADADGAFTVPDGQIHPHATFYIHVIAQNLDGDFSANYTTYKIISRDSSGAGGSKEVTTEPIVVDLSTVTELPQTGADL